MTTNWNAQVRKLKAVQGPTPLPGPAPAVTRPTKDASPPASTPAKTTETPRRKEKKEVVEETPRKEKKEVQEMGGVKFVVQRLNSNAPRRNRRNSAKSVSKPVSSSNTGQKVDETNETGTASDRDADLPLTVAGAVALGFATLGSVLVSVGFGGGIVSL